MSGTRLRPRGVLFDLDGTLVDSRRDIATAVNRVRAELGQAALSLAAVSGMVGEGARTLLERALPALSAADFAASFASFLRHYDRVCVDSTTLYDGMRELVLDAAAVWPLAVLTNKPEAMSRKILRHLDLLTPFRAVIGGDTLSARKPDPSTVTAAAERLGLAPADVALVGDSLIDAETAANAACALCLVSWGFRPRAELLAARPDALCDDVAAVRSRLGL